VTDPVDVHIDTTVPNAARVYDYLLGGSANFEVDRQAAESNNAVLPGGIATARAEVRANRDFLVRAVRYLAAEVGVRQFLDIGTGIPNDDHVHAVAQSIAPESRIVYVDYDPTVLAHADQLLRGTEGTTAYVHGDLREPEAILERAAATLDLSRPVALVLVGILYLIGDDDDPHGIVRRLVDALPSGSHLVVSHMTQDINPEMAELAKRLNETMKEPFVMRSHDEVARFFDGLELVEPGVVQVNEWRRPDSPPPSPDGWKTAYFVGVGRKP
jgi:S-adenosyl methyltransferase